MTGGSPAGVRMLVCGGRGFNDRRAVFGELDRVTRNMDLELVISGGAAGADTLAAEWAEANGVPLRVFPADWPRHGRAAGPIRNQRMLDEGRPDLVLAFPGGAGTADMARRASSAGVAVRSVDPRRVGGGAVRQMTLGSGATSSQGQKTSMTAAVRPSASQAGGSAPPG